VDVGAGGGGLVTIGCVSDTGTGAVEDTGAGSENRADPEVGGGLFSPIELDTYSNPNPVSARTVTPIVVRRACRTRVWRGRRRA